MGAAAERLVGRCGMFISEAAAHSIVQEIKEITGHNINIMDAAGVIFASTDPERIGQRHLGACQVLEQGPLACK